MSFSNQLSNLFKPPASKTLPRRLPQSPRLCGLAFASAGVRRKTLMLPRPLSYCESHNQNPAMVAEMDRLLDDHNYADVARILNENGFKTGDGLPLTSPAVGYIRTAYGLKSRFDRLRARGMLTMVEIAKRCGVSTNTISDWRRKVRIRAHAINDRNQFLFEDPGPNPPRKHVRRSRVAIISGTQYSPPEGVA